MDPILLAKILAGLNQLESICNDIPELIGQVEEQYEQIAANVTRDVEFFAARNRFRIRHAASLQIRRPRVLFGSREKYLNFHVIPLLRVADVVFVSLAIDQTPDDDVIIVEPTGQGMDHVLASLPKGFVPDLYFNYQTCALDRLLSGLERAPFPTVASLCHHFKAWKIDAIARQYDYVLPLSSTFCEILSHTVDPRKIIDVPFGMSWGSFHRVILAPADDPRPIDVLLTFPTGDTPIYGPYRTIITELFEKARAKYGDRFRFEVVTGLSRDQYLNTLTTARIVLNAVGIHGPYNYRTCEAPNAGAVLMQYEPHFATGPQGMENILVPDQEYVGFDETDFEAKLEALLFDPKRCEAIAHAGQTRMMEDYAYESLYQNLFAIIAAKTDWRDRRPSARESALARLHEYMDVNGLMQYLAIPDLVEATQGTDIHPAALVMPFYPIVQCVGGPDALADMVGGLPKTTDLRALRLAFYDRALAALPKPTTVDRFNHLVLSAAEGAINLEACLQLEAELETEPHLDHNARARIVAPTNSEIPEALATLADIAVRNCGYLLAKDESGRQAAARDFMLIWVYWLGALGGLPAQELRAAAKAILEDYPLWEGAKVPDYLDEGLLADAVA